MHGLRDAETEIRCARMVRVRARHIGESDGERAAGDRSAREAEIGRIAGEVSDEHRACACAGNRKHG